VRCLIRRACNILHLFTFIWLYDKIISCLSKGGETFYMIKDIKDVYSYREMLRSLVKKDLRTRYKGSFLGFLWTFVNPLLQLVVYTVIFSTIMRMNIDKFYMFLFVALVPWIFFSTSVQLSTSSIVGNKELVKKIYFPRVVLPMAVVNSGFMNMLFSFVIVLIAVLISGIGINWTIIYLPLVMLAEYILTLGFSILFSALNVYFRDLEHLLGIILMAWFYFTPIVFPVEMIPAKYFKLFMLNPVTHVILPYRDILYYGVAPDIKMIGISILIGLLLLIFSFEVFDRLQKNFAEEI
jgi:lipopolysaccharide transport system permease protein